MKIGITGATGQLGSLVVEHLKNRVDASNLVALVRSPEKVEGIEARAFDYEKPEALVDALKGIDTLLLISGNEIGKRTTQHTNVINAAVEAGVGRVVYTSILKADTTSISLAGEHVETEKLLEKSGINYTILRNGWYTENYTANLAGSVQAGALVGSAGEGKISSATRNDFAEAAAVVLTQNESGQKVYELSGDEAYTLSDLAAEVSKQTGKNIPYQNLPEEKYSEILKGLGIPDLYAEGIASWDVSASKGDLYDDGTTLSTLIGRPTTPLSEAVKVALS
ncbi:SDR family oxidoreductase [Phaeocystidibacter marisrubri]|uniref:SDR family oxidoreductase n=1 Tax=Phaeocystidibacter marisrubri TaxID=1577780 RepID=A0A6L3ZHQ6_9FLAO|nr:SDR family oxidoreductase [Phaeocystidibacter marisrubri]KAB2817394.1 SDR family oxidoreductase [Phaeocystidibacter marisrubri]GGH75564.1 NAD(P)-dependent oxidoreductase [Phaeocystidibacter marisrubri]